MKPHRLDEELKTRKAQAEANVDLAYQGVEAALRHLRAVLAEEGIVDADE